MKKCLLCGRKLNSNENNYGNGCILKCYRLLDMDYKNIKNKETVLNNKIAKISENKNLNNTSKVKLTERYLSLVLLSSVDIAFYDKYKEDIKQSINKKSFIGNELIELKEAYEIYKFYNKFYDALHIKNNEIIFSEITHNIIWKALNFGLSRYYNNKKYLSGITQKLQYVFWKSGVKILSISGLKVSTKLLNHAINENPKNLLITKGFIIEEIKNSNSFKNKIRDLLQKCDDSISMQDSIEFKEKDLKASLHYMNLNINGKKINGNWNIKVKLEDVFDFTDLKELHEYIDNEISGFILSTANNAAMISTSCGVLKPYSITIEFEYKIGDAFEI